MAYTEPRTGGHIGRYRVDGDLKATAVFKRKRDALAEAEKQEESAKRQDWTDPARAKITVGEWYPMWLDQLEVSDKTRAGYDDRQKRIALVWDGVPLKRIAREDFVKWVRTMQGAKGGPVGDTTRNDTAKQFVRMIDAAVADDRLPRNPVRDRSGKLPKIPAREREREHRYLDAEDVHLLAETARDVEPTPERGRETEALIYLMAYCGPRPGEVAAFNERDFNRKKGTIRVVKAYSTVGGKLILGPTKTHERRTIRLPEFVANKLGVMLDDRNGRSPDEPLFRSPRGMRLRIVEWARKVFKPAAAKAGVDPLVPYDLRHTAASLAVASGATVLAVQKMLGHKDAAMTLNVYADLFDGDVVDLAQRLSKVAEAEVEDDAA
ncbi:phage integrase family protein [Haloactinopolyspora alba]|uniref:Phage integrase family protein n=1 Tax=Haloactinopolyspora alba TaxID=648780 RepID=A0A2P8E3P8_9ACTN|nr:site-specific integrase [Haloactinopolyspora alba]PSL04089.1 phage integrase family protein [Haloactinopolyspora alba]